MSVGSETVVTRSPVNVSINGEPLELSDGTNAGLMSPLQHAKLSAAAVDFAARNVAGLYTPVSQATCWVYKSRDTADTERDAWWIYVSVGGGHYSAHRLTRWANPTKQTAPNAGAKALALLGAWIPHTAAAKVGGWVSINPGYAYDGVLTTSGTAGETISFSATGHTLSLRATRQQACGYAVVSIDGDYAAANRCPTFTAADLTAGLCRAEDVGRRYVNFYGATTFADVHIPIAEGLIDAAHTVVLENTGTKVPAAALTRVRLAGLVAVSASTINQSPGAAYAFAHIDTASYMQLIDPQDLPVCGLETSTSNVYQIAGGIHTGSPGDGEETLVSWSLRSNGSDAIASMAAGHYASAYSVQSKAVTSLATSDAPGTVVANKRQDIVWSAGAVMPMIVRTSIKMVIDRRISDAYHAMLTLSDFDPVDGVLKNTSWGNVTMGRSTFAVRQNLGSIGYLPAVEISATNERGRKVCVADLNSSYYRDAYASRGSFLIDSTVYTKCYLVSSDTYAQALGFAGDEWWSEIGFAVLP